MKNKNKFDYQNITLSNDISNSNNFVDVELNGISLNSPDPENKIFIIKKTSLVRNTANLEHFKIKKCEKIKSILHKNLKYNSIRRPRDDTHAFYIKRDSKGVFLYKFNKDDCYETKKKFILKNKIEEFISSFNKVVDINQIKMALNKLYLLKVLFIFLIIFCLCLLSYYSLIIIIYIIAFAISYKRKMPISYDRTQDSNSGLNKIETYFVFILLVLVTFFLIKIYKFYSYKKKLIIFTHMLNKKTALENEIDKWNTNVFYAQNMKVQLADTFDYIQVFYDRYIVYEIDDHF